MTALFIDHATAASTAEMLQRVRVCIRKARRWTTKAESRGGQEANRALHEAETDIDRALAALGARS